jgi:hypothetical protein
MIKKNFRELVNPIYNIFGNEIRRILTSLAHIEFGKAIFMGEIHSLEEGSYEIGCFNFTKTE